MERLLYSPDRTREEYRYQTTRPSSQLMPRTAFTLTAPLRGHDIVSDSLDLAHKLSGAMPLRKTSEKELLQGLNDRFAGFIEKVHHLENQNKALEGEIGAIRLKAKSSASLSKEYECELNDLRRHVHEMSLQKHQIEITRQNLEDEFNTLRDRYDRESRDRADTERNISVLKKRISDAYLAKQEMDRKATALEAEISFLKVNHESEVAEMMVQMQDGQAVAEKPDFSRSDLTAALRDVRMKLEGHAGSDTRYAEGRFKAQLAKLTKAAEVSRDALMATTAEIHEHRRQLQSKHIELDSVKGVREALEKQLYDLEQCHNAEIHHYQDTIRELEFELKNAKYDMSSHLREYQDLLNVKMGLDAEIYSYRKLLEGEESRYSTISDEHISVPYIYRQSPIYTLPCVTRQGGGRRAEPQYKFVEEIITETTREDVEISDTGSEKSGEAEGDQPDVESGEKDTEGDVSQEAIEEEPEPAVEDSNGGNTKAVEEENEVKPSEESDDVEDKPAENMTDVSEVHQDTDNDSKPTRDKTFTKKETDETDQDRETDSKRAQHKDLKDDMKGDAEIAQLDVSAEGDVKTDKPTKQAEKDVPKLDLSEELSVKKAEKSDGTGPENKTPQEPHNPEITAQVNDKPSEPVIEMTSQRAEDDGHKDATVATSQDPKTTKTADKEKETTVKSVEMDVPTPDPQPAPEHAENGQKTISVKETKDKSENITSPKKEIPGTVNAEAKICEYTNQEDTSKITEAEKPAEKHQETQSPNKEQKTNESIKKEDSKADGVIDSVKTEKEENKVKLNDPAKSQEEISKVAEEKLKPEEAKKQEDSKDNGADSVKTSGGETKGTDKKVDETQSNAVPKAMEPQSDAKPEQKENQESKVKMTDTAEGPVTTQTAQTDSGDSRHVKSEETVPKEKQSESGSHELKKAESDSAIKPEAKALKTETVKESSKEDKPSV